MRPARVFPDRYEDPIFGPVLSITRHTYPPEGCRICVVQAHGWTVPGLATGNKIEGGGYAADFDTARRSAIGELLERAALMSSAGRDVWYATHAELEAQRIAYVPRADFVHVDPDANDYAAVYVGAMAYFGRECREAWLPSIRLSDGAMVLVPSGAARFQDYIPTEAPLDPTDGGTLFLQATSTGAASGPSLEDATMRGLFEAVERDSFMLHWYTRTTPPQISRDSVPELWSYVDQVCAEVRGQAYLLDLSSVWGIPDVLCLIIGPSGRYGIGMSAAPTWIEAGRSALHEAAALYNNAAWFVKDAPTRADEIRDFDGHVAYYLSGHGPVEAYHFLVEGPDQPVRVPDFPQPEAASEHVRTMMGKHGLSPYLVDITPLNYDRADSVVVHVLIPGLCDLETDHRLPHHNNARILRMAGTCGLRRIECRNQINRDPHPFP